MINLRVPDKKYFVRAKKIITDEIFPKLVSLEFNNVRRAIYGNQKILQMMTRNGIKVREISSGVSDRPAFRGYIMQIVNDLKKDRYYRDYYPSKGSLEARQAMAIRENYKFGKKNIYGPEDFCITEGSTGAITMVFEYLSKKYPGSEVLIQSPNYYLYKFASNYYGLQLREIMPDTGGPKISFVDADLIARNITGKTKLVIITNPSNPSGEIFGRPGLKRILAQAKKYGALVLADELFSELVFSPRDYVCSDSVAESAGALENLVVIKGYSKSKNLVGLRIGYLFSKNRGLVESAAVIAQQRSSYSAASNFTGLIALDSFIQSVRFNGKGRFDSTLKDFAKISSVSEKKRMELLRIFENYEKYFADLMKYYSARFDDITKVLGKDAEISFPKTSAFNTIVKIKGLTGVNSFDFMISCFLATGLKTEIAPCFGLDQKTWDNDLGFWLRLTFAKDRNGFRRGLLIFKKFKKEYLEKPGRFLKTEREF